MVYKINYLNTNNELLTNGIKLIYDKNELSYDLKTCLNQLDYALKYASIENKKRILQRYLIKYHYKVKKYYLLIGVNIRILDEIQYLKLDEVEVNKQINLLMSSLILIEGIEKKKRNFVSSLINYLIINKYENLKQLELLKSYS